STGAQLYCCYSKLTCSDCGLLAFDYMAHDNLKLPKSRFVPLLPIDNVEYISSGSAADVWKITTSASSSEGQLPTLRVSKVLCISPEHLGPPGGVNERVQNPAWESFVKTYCHKVTQWSSLRYETVVRVHQLQQGLNLNVEFCLNGSVRDALLGPGGEKKDRWKIVEWLQISHANPPILLPGKDFRRIGWPSVPS
ncbi:unnamed protein product, partial [Rhizoctonia solani]